MLIANDEDILKYSNKFPHLTFRIWYPYVLNVLQRDVSKSIAVLEVLDYFGIHQSELY